MSVVAGWCLDHRHRDRCKSTRCECVCHTLRDGAWHGLGTPTQVALKWLVGITLRYGQGDPHASDLTYLRGLERDGYAERTTSGAWRATRKGVGLWQTRDERPQP